jgi:actin related protein 2/3 complex subunit 1A/1B
LILQGIAVCPNDSTVLIYAKEGMEWKVEHTLRQHDSVVTGIDWAPRTNRLVTCSQDRNAYVWHVEPETGAWKPDLVILRINRAATDVKWSPKEDKFAVASGAKVVSVCHFEEDNDWWVSKHIKKHRSTVTRIAWHPNNQILATASTDFKARVFSASIREVDKKQEPNPWGTKPFGEPLAEFDCAGWVHAVAFSPSGNRLVYVGHDSTITFAEVSQGTAPAICVVKLAMLPLADCMFLDETKVVAAGHDCQPYLFSSSAPAKWELVKSLDEKPKAAAGAGGDDRFKKFQNMVDKGTTDAAALQTTVDTKHQNTITCIRCYKRNGPRVLEFTTSGLDGAVVWWK